MYDRYGKSHGQHTDGKHEDKTQGHAGNGDKQNLSTQPSQYYSGANSKRPELGPVAPDGLLDPTLGENYMTVDGRDIYSEKSPAVSADHLTRRSHPGISRSAPVPPTTNEHAAGAELTRNDQDRPRDRPGSAAHLHSPRSNSSALTPSPPPPYHLAVDENPAANPAGNTGNRTSLDRQDDPPPHRRYTSGTMQIMRPDRQVDPQLHYRRHTSGTMRQSLQGRLGNVRGLASRVTGAMINSFLPSVESRSRNRLRRQSRRHNDDEGGSRTGNGNGRGHGMN